jgi:pyruvate,orthophosphate dikinase
MAPLTDHDVLRIVVFKGRTTADAVAASLRTEAQLAAARLASLVDAGLVEPTGGERVKPTDAGRQRLDDFYAEERAGCQPRIEAVLDGFHAPNDVFKEVVTSWQLRSVGGEPVPNDHRDLEYDGAVLRRLRDDVHTAIVPLIDDAGDALPRLGLYRERLDDALGRIDKGEHQYIAHPLLDSYHTVWFELHEELIRLAGRDRAVEAAAGRA